MRPAIRFRHFLTAFRYMTIAWMASIPCSLSAQPLLLDVTLHADLDSLSAGCLVEFSNLGSSLHGIDQQVRATVDREAKIITNVTIADCDNGSFVESPPIATDIPVALNEGLHGEDAIELSAPIFSLLMNSPYSLLWVSTFDPRTGSEDVTDEPYILLQDSVAVPTLGTWALTLTALLLLGIGLVALRRNPQFLTISLLAVCAVAVAAHFVADGNLDDWNGETPSVVDNLDDAVPPQPSTDITLVFFATEDEHFFARVDLVDIENTAPQALPGDWEVNEDDSVTIRLEAQDPEGDELTFAIIDSPENGALGAITPFDNDSADVEYTPVADYFGPDLLTFTVNDGVLDSDPALVTITVRPVNDPPSFAGGSDESVLEDAGLQTLNGWATAISPGPANESDQTVTFNVSNDNSALFAMQPAVDTAGTLTYTPADDANGLATVTVVAMDDGGTANGGMNMSPPQMFTITVTAVNDAPEFTAGPDQEVDEDAPAQNIAAWATGISAGPPDESGQTLTFDVTNDNNALFSVQPAVNLAGDLSYTPQADAHGLAIVTVTLMDDGGTANGGNDSSAPQMFTISVLSVNDPPSFTAGPNQMVLEDAGLQTVPAWATNISPGPADESGQTVSFNVSNDNNALFSAQPAVDPTGTLTYTPADNASGVATVTVEAMDDGGTANGGNDTSPPHMFTITVSSVNDPPILDPIGNQSVDELVLLSFTATASDPNDTPPDNLTFSLSGEPAGASISAGGMFTWTPTEAQGPGMYSFDVVVTDDGTPNELDFETITVTVNEVNLPPVLDMIGNQMIDEGTAFMFTAMASDPDLPANTLTFSLSGEPAGAGISAGGAFSWTPSEAQGPGMYTFDVIVTDDGPGLLSDFETITIDVAEVNQPPAADDESYDAIGNVGITVNAASGLLVGDTDPDLPPQAVTITAETVASANGGSATIAADGSFTYEPPPGYEGVDTFSYTLNDNDPGGNLTDTGTVTVTVSGVIWFIDSTAAPGGDGRLSSPFNCISGAGCFDPTAMDDPGDNIFLADGAYTGGLSLLNDQRLIGDGSSSDLATIAGITVPMFSDPLPTFSGTDPTITSSANGINLGMGNTVRGLAIGDVSGTGLSGTTVGSLTISEVTIGDGTPSGGAIEVSTSGALNVTFDNLSASSSTDEGIRLNNVSGTFTVTGTGGSIQTSNVPAIEIDGNPSLAVSMTFASVGASGGTNGIVLSDTTGSFSVTGTGTAGSGGTIQNMTGANGATAGIGIRLSNAQNISLGRMQINDHQNFAIRGAGVSGFTLADSVVNGANGDSAADDEGSIRFTNLAGTANFTGSIVAGGWEDNIRIDNSTGSLTMNVMDSASNPMIIGLNSMTFGNDGILLETTATAMATLTVDGVEFLGARGDMIQANALGTSTQDVTIQNSTFHNSHTNIVSAGGGITLSGGSNVSNILVGYDVNNNEFSGSDGNAITANYLSNEGAVTGVIQNNTIGTAVAQSGSVAGAGIAVGASKNGAGGGDIVHTVLIDDNFIQSTEGLAAIDIISNQGANAASRAEVNATVTNNNVSGLGGFAFTALNLLVGGSAVSGDFALLCADISDNTFDASGATLGGGNAVFFDQISSDAHHNQPGYMGSPNGEFVAAPGTASADLDAFLAGNGNTMMNGAFPTFPLGGVDAGLVQGLTGTGASCP